MESLFCKEEWFNLQIWNIEQVEDRLAEGTGEIDEHSTERCLQRQLDSVMLNLR